MKNRRYALLLMDSTGRSIRRIGVSRRSLELAVGALAISLLVGAGMLIHGVVRYDVAAEAQAIRSENAELQAMLVRLGSQLPALRHALGRSERSFAQLWSRSGLGVEPRLLGAGPHEAGDGPGGLIDEPLAAPVNGDLLDLDPFALPFEAERIRSDGRALQHSLAEVQEYFNDAQRLLSHTPSIRPTATPWLTSSFGRRRDPIDHHSWVMHKGLDLGGHIGKQIVAPADGVVIFVGNRGGYGQTVVIDHGYGLQTHYAHLSKYRVTRGQRVRRGELIAEMGSTGKSTGPHLHYEVRRLGNPLDPRRFILDWSPTSRAAQN